MKVQANTDSNVPDSVLATEMKSALPIPLSCMTFAKLFKEKPLNQNVTPDWAWVASLREYIKMYQNGYRQIRAISPNTIVFTT